MVELRTGRVVIREFEPADDEFVLRLLNGESFLRFIGDKGVRTLEDAREYLRTGPMASYATHGYGLFLVTEKASGEPIGMCGLLKRDDQPLPDIGFAFLAEFQSGGYAYESAAAVLEFGHVQRDIDTIAAFVNPDNERSIRLLLRLGFDLVGVTNLDGIPSPQNMYSRSVAT